MERFSSFSKPLSTGFISRSGVPSSASSGATRRRPLSLSILRIFTLWRPIGFGREGDRVANTPFKGASSFPRGCAKSLSLSAKCSHVKSRTSRPASRPSIPSRYSGAIRISASTPPSNPCFGQSSRLNKEERTTPIRNNRIVSHIDDTPFSSTEKTLRHVFEVIVPYAAHWL